MFPRITIITTQRIYDCKYYVAMIGLTLVARQQRFIERKKVFINTLMHISVSFIPVMDYHPAHLLAAPILAAPQLLVERK